MSAATDRERSEQAVGQPQLVRLYKIPQIDPITEETLRYLEIKMVTINGHLRELTFPDEEALITFEAIRQGVFKTNSI